jgi:hypothetical protein
MPMDLFGRYLPALYASGRSLAATWEDEVAAAPALPAPVDGEMPLLEAPAEDATEAGTVAAEDDAGEGAGI